MKIREAQGIDDAKLIADIYRSDIGKFGTTHTEEDVEEIYNNVKKELEELGENRIVLLGFEDDRPVCTVQLLLKRADNDPGLANGLTITHAHHLRVAYDRHKSGLGKEMMNEVESYAKKHRFRKITLGVDDWNINAISFYKRLGYRQLKEAEGKNPGEKLIYMYKNLE